MSKSIIVAAALLPTLLIWSAAPVLAQSACTAPIPPAALDGATATMDQVRGAIKDAKAFIADSDVYQTCLGKEIDDAKAKAATDKVPFDKSLATAAMAKADENQKLKVKVAGEANSASVAYKKAHPPS